MLNPATRRFTHLSFSTNPEEREDDESLPLPQLQLEKKRKFNGDWSSSSSTAVLKKTALRPLQIVSAQQSGQRVHEYISKSNDSPWETYNALYDIRLSKHDYIIVAERRRAGPLIGSVS